MWDLKQLFFFNSGTQDYYYSPKDYLYSIMNYFTYIHIS